MKFIKSILYWLPNKIFGPNQHDKKNREIENFMRHTAAVAVAVFAVISIIFILNLLFGPTDQSGNKFSSLGTIGDFLGGTLNPAFAFLGFIALLYTLRLNQRELNQATDEMRRTAEAAELQVRQDELQQLIAIQDKNIDRLLNQNFKINASEYTSDLGKIVDLFTFLMRPTTESRTYELINTENYRSHTSVVTLLIQELAQLSDITKEHHQISESIVTRSFFATKYYYVIYMLEGKGLLKKVLEEKFMLNYIRILEFATDCYMGENVADLYEKIEELSKKYIEKEVRQDK